PLLMQDTRQRRAVPPAVALQIRYLRQLRDGTDAEPRHRPHVLRHADEIAQELLAVETDPPHPEALGRRGEPQVLDRANHRVEPGIGDGVSPEHTRPAASRVVADHDPEPRLTDPFDLDPRERLGALTAERRRERV